MFVATKYFCHDRTICRDKYILSRKSFVATSILLSRQARVCLDKTRLCRDVFVATNISRDKSFVATNIILSQKKTCFVATNTCLWRQKSYLWQLPPMILYSRYLSDSEYAGIRKSDSEYAGIRQSDSEYAGIRQTY